MEDKLKKAIVNQQGDLLYTTLAEECSELAQASSKIVRKKFYNQSFDIDNLLEEIYDVEMNIELIKEQLINEKLINVSMEEINEKLKEWERKKIEKISKIFLN